MASEKIFRKEREYLSRRAEILAQAEKIFAAKGYYATTMAEIAEASGFAIGSLYQFFQGKEHLYESLIKERLDTSYHEIKTACGGAESVRSKIEAMLRAYFTQAEKSENFFAILTRWEGLFKADKSPSPVTKLMENYQRLIALIVSIFEEGRSRGDFPNIDTRAPAIALLGMIDAFAFNWLISTEKYPLQEQVDTVLTIFFQGIESYE